MSVEVRCSPHHAFGNIYISEFFSDVVAAQRQVGRGEIFYYPTLNLSFAACLSLLAFSSHMTIQVGNLMQLFPLNTKIISLCNIFVRFLNIYLTSIIL